MKIHSFSSIAFWAFVFLILAASAPPAAAQQPGTQAWAFATGGGVVSSPALGYDGTIYVGSMDGNLYAVGPDGAQKWKFAAGGQILASPAVGQNGDIYVASEDGYLYCMSPAGAMVWRFQTGGTVDSSPAIGPDGTIYIAGGSQGNLYAVSPSGSQIWVDTNVGMGSLGSPAIGKDGTIYIGSQDSKLHAVAPDGTEKWAFTTKGWLTSSPAIAADGTIYFVSQDEHLYALDANGNEKWAYPLQQHQFGWSPSPTVGPDGTIYVGDFVNFVVHAINPDGSKRWDYASNQDVGFGENYTAPAVASDGTIYAGITGGTGNFNRLVALGPNGAERWIFNGPDQHSSSIYSSPAIGADGTVYFGCGAAKDGSSGSTLYAVRGTSGPAIGQWPMFHKDPQHTGTGRPASDHRSTSPCHPIPCGQIRALR